MSNFVDIAAIKDRIEEYCCLLNRRKWDELPDLWTEDAIWITTGTVRERFYKGRDSVVDAIVQTVETYPMLLQITGSAKVKVEGDAASSVCAIQEVVKVGEEEGIYLLGLYYDRLRRTAEGWKFVSREFHCRYFNRHKMTGDAFPLASPRICPEEFG